MCCLYVSRYDVDHSNFIDFMELKLMMEKLGEPQTHLALKEMIKAIDEDNDGEISFREVAAGAKFEEEIRAEQEKKKIEAGEKAERKRAFKEKASMWH
jgi:hypothetical protein